MIAAVVVLVLLVVAAMFAVQWTRRRQANLAANRVGGSVGHPAPPSATPSPAPMPQQGAVGAPNPAVPPPAAAPDHRVGSGFAGEPVHLLVCGLPAVAWQHGEQRENQWQPMRLSLIVDAGVGLPTLSIDHRGTLAHVFGGSDATIGIPALDERFRFVGELAAWGPVLAQPSAQQALLAFPLDSFDVMGQRITLDSLDGVHLDPGAASAIAQVAAVVVGAVPFEITSASPQAPPTALAGDPADPMSFVRGALERSQLSPEQQQAMMTLIEARQRRR